MTTLYRVSWRSLMALAVLFVLGAGNVLAQWSEMPYLSNARSLHAVAWLDGKIYIAGGLSSGTQLTDTRVLDVAGNASDWSNLTAIDGPRWGSYGAGVNGKFYITGGLFQTSSGYSFVVRTAEFDPAKNSYSLKAQMPVPVVQMAGTVVNGKILLFGGVSVSGNQFALTRTVQMYDPATDTWTKITDGPAAASGMSAVAIGNTVYLIGGNAGGSDFPNVYKGTFNGTDITDWAPTTDLPVATSGGAAGVLNGKIVYTGGRNGQILSTRTFIYDPATRKWTSSFGLPMPSADVHNLVGDGTALYLVSGDGNANVYKFVEGESKPVASVGPSDLLMTVAKGQTVTKTIFTENKGTAPLTITPEVPSTSPWLTAQSVTIAPGTKQEYNLTINTSALTAGYYTTTVDLKTNDASQASVPVTVHLFVANEFNPQPTKVVVEEGTGTWCGWCPYGHATIAELEDEHPGQIISMAYHGGTATDKMIFTAGQNLVNKLGLGGYPNATIQRWLFAGQSVRMLDINSNPDNFKAYADTVLDRQPMAPASITITKAEYNPTTKKITGTVHIKFDAAYALPAGSKIAMTVVAVQDSIVGEQTKYYSDGSPTDEFTDYVHRHAVRGMYPNENGLALTIPDAAMQDGYIMPGTEFTQDFTVTPQSNSTYAFDATHATIVALVQENIGTNLGPLLQGQEVPVTIASGASVDVTTGETRGMSLTHYPNPANGMTNIAFQVANSGSATVDIYNLTGQKVATVADGFRAAGTYNVQFDAAKLINGAYVVTLTSNGTKVSHFMSVVH